MIRATGGLGLGASITVNDSAGNFDASGNMHIGPTSGALPVTFDGCIRVKAKASLLR